MKGIDAKFVKYIGGQRPVDPEDVLDKQALYSTVSADDVVQDQYGVDSIKFMVDPVSGDDGNDGKSWATAKKTLQSAIDLIPFNLGGVRAYVLCKAGTSAENIIVSKNGDVLFVRPFSDVTDDFYLNGETPAFTDDPFILTGDINTKASARVEFSGRSLGGTPFGSFDVRTTGYFGIITEQYSSVFFGGCIVGGTGTYLALANSLSGLIVGSSRIQGDILVGDACALMQLNADVPIDAAYPKPFATRNAVSGDTAITAFSKVNACVTINVDQITVEAGAFTIDADKISCHAVSGDFTGVLTGSDVCLIVGESLVVRNLPSSDPAIAGVVWSNSGVMTVSAG